jgi:sulfite oxidase
MRFFINKTKQDIQHEITVDPFAHDPDRDPILKPKSVKPFNAEPPLEMLTENFLTPNNYFFVRNHLPVADILEEEYELTIQGLSGKEVVFSYEELKEKFKEVCTVQPLVHKVMIIAG